VRTGLPVLICALLVAAGCGGSDSDGAGAPDGFDGARAMRDVRAQVAIGPRPSGSAGAREEVALIVRSLRAAGIEDVAVQSPERNVVGVIPGSAPGAVVVGAHYDTKDAIPGFVGANDGASGVAVVLELARALPARLDGPSIHLALFDGEEARGDRPFERDGTRGSRQYVAYSRAGGRQGSPPLDQLHAMVLFDMVGDCDLQLSREATSDRTLYGAFADAAGERFGTAAPFDGGTGGGVLDDHTPFLQAGVPALDLIDFTYGPGPPPGAWWHTAEDTVDKVCADSLDVVGEAAVVAIPRIR
jgi:Zn-dependent M28 family amino/carboxypeptidase